LGSVFAARAILRLTGMDNPYLAMKANQHTPTRIKVFGQSREVAS